jgi:branched-chain amino acid transport system ATP-binding protein
MSQLPPLDDAPTPDLLQVSGLRKSYHGVTAVAGVAFNVPEHSIVGIIGPNGSGKSTTIDCITGFQAADAGQVLLDGQDLMGMSSWKIARAGMTRTFQTVRVYDQLSLMDNLLIAMQSFDAVNWIDAVLRTRRLRDAEAAAAARAMDLIKIGRASCRERVS